MPKPGTDFEELAKRLFSALSAKEEFTSVEGPKVHLPGRDVAREFDVVLRSKVAGIDILTVIECRDYGKKLDITHLDGFVSKMEDVNANKGILVSRKGFSKSAIQKAERLGVSLYVAKSADPDEVSGLIEEASGGLPIVVSEVASWSVDVNVEFRTLGKTTFDNSALLAINDTKIVDVMFDCVSRGQVSTEATGQVQVVRPYEHLSSRWIRDNSGTKIAVEKAELRVVVETVHYYFGYEYQLPNSAALIDQIEQNNTLFLQTEDFMEGSYRERFKKYSKLEDIPEFGFVSLRVLAMPKATPAIQSLKVARVGD